MKIFMTLVMVTPNGNTQWKNTGRRGDQRWNLLSEAMEHLAICMSTELDRASNMVVAVSPGYRMKS